MAAFETRRDADIGADIRWIPVEGHHNISHVLYEVILGATSWASSVRYRTMSPSSGILQRT